LDEESEPIMEECDECGGYGYIEQEIVGYPVIEKHYEVMIEFIRDVLSENNYNYLLVNELEAFLLNPAKGYENYSFDDIESRIYTELSDEIMHLCLNTFNEPLKTI
jgi:hypothetical protein